MSTRLSLICIAVAGSVMAAAGCGGGGAAADYPSARLEGTVSIDGKRLESGAVQFMPSGGQAGNVVQAPILGGRYAVPGVPLGKVTVMIVMPTESAPTQVSSDYQPPKTLTLPDRYKSGIPIEIKGDNPDQNFDLTSRE